MSKGGRGKFRESRKNRNIAIDRWTGLEEADRLNINMLLYKLNEKGKIDFSDMKPEDRMVIQYHIDKHKERLLNDSN